MSHCHKQNTIKKRETPKGCMYRSLGFALSFIIYGYFFVYLRDRFISYPCTTTSNMKVWFCCSSRLGFFLALKAYVICHTSKLKIDEYQFRLSNLSILDLNYTSNFCEKIKNLVLTYMVYICFI